MRAAKTIIFWLIPVVFATWAVQYLWIDRNLDSEQEAFVKSKKAEYRIKLKESLSESELTAYNETERVYDLQWQVLFVGRQLLLVMCGLALLFYEYKRGSHKRLPHIMLFMFLMSYELIGEIFGINKKGSWFEILWIIITGVFIFIGISSWVRHKTKK